MKNPPVENPASVMRLITASALFFVPSVLGIAFWLVTSSTGVAGPNMCDVCHKTTLTITLACNSLEYRRHIDHGDPAHACGATVINRKPTGDAGKKDGGG
jgi:hypothetical protein